MQVHFVARENGPERLVTEAEIHFDEGPLAGARLVGVCLWKSPEGEFRRRLIGLHTVSVRAGPRELGQGQPRLSTGVHVAVHPGSDGRAEGLVQRAVPEDDVAGERRRPARDALADRRRLAPRPDPDADAGGACERRQRCARRGGTLPGRRDPRSAVHRTGLTEPYPSRGRAGLGAVLRGRARLYGARRPEARGDQAFDALSPRERAILALLAEGLANAEIAERLAISEKTVRNHVSNVFDKLGVWTRAQAIVFARDRGFRE